MGPVQYNNRKFRIAAAFAASLFIIVYGKPFDFHKAAVSPGFYLVLAISFAAALLLVELVHFMTVKLDGRFGWRSMFPERLFLQIIYCILVPASLDLLLFSVYFSALGQSILKNGFFHIDFPVIIGMLMLLSFYYCLRYWMLTDSRNVAKQMELAMGASQKDKSTENDTLLLEHKGLHVYFKLHDILYFYRNGKNVYFMTEDGHEYLFNLTIGSLVDRYGKNGFIRINRGMVINSRIIIGYKVGSRKNTLQLMINERYSGLILTLGAEQFQVTKEYISTFRSSLQA